MKIAKNDEILKNFVLMKYLSFDFKETEILISTQSENFQFKPKVIKSLK